MAVTAGALSKSTIAQTTATVVSAAATAGTGPYTYQWYLSTVSGFTPGAGNLVAGATSLTQLLSGLQPGTTYYAVVIATDTGAGNATSQSAQLTFVTAPAQAINQFIETMGVGVIDQRLTQGITPAMIDVSEVSVINQAGTAVKLVSTSSGVPKVVACTTNGDNVWGFIAYDIKSQTFQIGASCEIASADDVIYLVSVGPIPAGSQVQLDLTYQGGVKVKTTSSGATYVGYALDSAAGDGQVIRVHLLTPTFIQF